MNAEPVITVLDSDEEGDSSWRSTGIGTSAIPSSEFTVPYPNIMEYQKNSPQGRHASTHTQLSRQWRRYDPRFNSEMSNDNNQLPTLQDWYNSVGLSSDVFQRMLIKDSDNLSSEDATTAKTLRDKLISTLQLCPTSSSWSYRLWHDIRDNCTIYPITIFYLFTMLSVPRAQKLLEVISSWNIWNPVKIVVDHDMIKASISEFMTLQTHTIDLALRRDLVDLSAFVERTISSTASRPIIMSLSEPEVQQFASVLRMRMFERFIRTLVKHTNIFPEYLFVAKAKRAGKNPYSGGGFADVWRGKLKGKPIAMKVLRMYQCGKDQLEIVHQKFCEEALLWQQLEHENILPFLGVCKDEFAPMLAMISPWMDNGTLVTYLQEYDLDAPQRQRMVRGVVAGLHFLHTLKPVVVHGDLRAGNILIDFDKKPRIADFGLSRIIDSQASSVVATSFNGKGTMRWQAPELLNASRFGGENTGVTTKSDVYAFACVCWEIFTGQIPFANLRDGEVILAVAVNDKRPSRPAEPATSRGLDDEHWKLMQSCWATVPVDRPSMGEVKNILKVHFENLLRVHYLRPPPPLGL
ncbi:kinase-like protein [Rickenella mellea]|uniref:Kinase-like protein n=1 Tax=Rickenella mellea TaxID=50990 RepID=A0A4Y7PZR7_9AGAM|nr:kinase-like protein [Rickenella mellea]